MREEGWRGEEGGKEKNEEKRRMGRREIRGEE